MRVSLCSEVLLIALLVILVPGQLCLDFLKVLIVGVAVFMAAAAEATVSIAIQVGRVISMVMGPGVRVSEATARPARAKDLDVSATYRRSARSVSSRFREAARRMLQRDREHSAREYADTAKVWRTRSRLSLGMQLRCISLV